MKKIASVAAALKRNEISRLKICLFQWRVIRNERNSLNTHFTFFFPLIFLTTVLYNQVPEYRTLYDKAIEAHDAKKKTAANSGKFELLPKTPVSKFTKVAKIGATFGGMVKSVSAAPQSQERSGSIAAALKKTADVAMEIGGSAKLLSNVVEVIKKSEGTGIEYSEAIR